MTSNQVRDILESEERSRHDRRYEAVLGAAAGSVHVDANGTARLDGVAIRHTGFAGRPALIVGDYTGPISPVTCSTAKHVLNALDQHEPSHLRELAAARSSISGWSVLRPLGLAGLAAWLLLEVVLERHPIAELSTSTPFVVIALLLYSIMIIVVAPLSAIGRAWKYARRHVVARRICAYAADIERFRAARGGPDPASESRL